MKTSANSRRPARDRLLELRDLERSFDGQAILRRVSLTVNRGEIVALLGPSGCGKTTLLRIIAGLETADAGQIFLEGRDLTKIPVHKRGFGLVFQEYALFPHKNVAENIAFGLRMMGWERSLQEKRVIQVLKLVGLSGFENRRVYELSGGEQQRVALARSLAPSPRLVLLDEPLGALDRALREQLMGELRTILKEAGTKLVDPRDTIDPEMGPFPPSMVDPTMKMTSIYVTHDQEEAFAIADRVIVMNAGQIEQQGTPVQLFRQPESRFVARFLGMDNFLEATLLSDDLARVKTEIGEFQIIKPVAAASGQLTLLVRPGAGSIMQKGKIGDNLVSGLIQDISFRGRHQMVTFLIPTRDGKRPLRLSFDSSVIFPTEPAEITLWLDPTELQLLSR